MVAHTLLIARLAYLIDYSNIAVQENAETSTAELSQPRVWLKVFGTSL